MPPSSKQPRLRSDDLSTAKRRAVRVMDLWRRVVEEHDRLARAAAHGKASGRSAARRRLDALYELTADGRPSPAVLEFWLTNRESADLRDFRIWLLHRHVQALVSAARATQEWSSIDELSTSSARFAIIALGARRPAAQRTKEIELERALREVLAEEHADQPGKWWDAVRVLARLKRFKSESTITRALRDHRRREANAARASSSVSPAEP